MSETQIRNSRTILKLDGIATFVAIAEAGSLSEAARRLHLSKSVVSDRLAELERGLGASLLHRSARRLTLTEDGAAFLERAARIAREVEEAAADMAERRGALVGPLRISAPVTFGRMHLGPAIYPFLARHPEIERPSISTTAASMPPRTASTRFSAMDPSRIRASSPGRSRRAAGGLSPRRITWHGAAPRLRLPSSKAMAGSSTPTGASVTGASATCKAPSACAGSRAEKEARRVLGRAGSVPRCEMRSQLLSWSLRM